MGLFDHLFKSLPQSSGDLVADESSTHGAVDSAATAKQQQPDQSAFLHPKGGHGGDLATPEAPPIPPLRSCRPEFEPEPRDIVLTLADLLPRIPTHFHPTGTIDSRRELRFSTEDLASDIARGRATVMLSEITAQCPDLFPTTISPADDVAIRLPLQKLLDQLIHPVAAPQFPSEENAAKFSAPVFVENSNPSADHDGSTIYLSLSAIVANSPDELFGPERPRADDSVRLAFPFALIEQQLNGGSVQIDGKDFLTLLPPSYAGCFRLHDGVKISLPLDEIFQNLPKSAHERCAPPAIAPQAAATPTPSSPEPVASRYRFFAPTSSPDFEPSPTTSVSGNGHKTAPAANVDRSTVPATAGELQPLPLPVVEAPAVRFPDAETQIAATLPVEIPSAPVALTDTANGAHTTSPAPAPGRLMAFPPVRALELRATADTPLGARPTLTFLQSSNAAHSTLSEVSAPPLGLARPPLVRPLIVAPPPILREGSADLRSMELPSAPEPRLETTADQAAILDFLSDGDPSQPSS